jgi:hypothetical protein
MFPLLSHPEDGARPGFETAPDRSVALELTIEVVMFIFKAEIYPAPRFHAV